MPATLADTHHYLHDWNLYINPMYFALNALCQLAAEHKTGNCPGYDYWKTYWTVIYVNSKERNYHD